MDRLSKSDLQQIADDLLRTKRLSEEGHLDASIDDLLEALLHDVLDLGRLALQLLEDLFKLERQVFVGVCHLLRLCNFLILF